MASARSCSLSFRLTNKKNKSISNVVPILTKPTRAVPDTGYTIVEYMHQLERAQCAKKIISENDWVRVISGKKNRGAWASLYRSLQHTMTLPLGYWSRHDEYETINHLFGIPERIKYRYHQVPGTRYLTM